MTDLHETPCVGVSGLSLYVPRLRVSLEAWCEWTGNPWAKISRVVGRSFRMPARHEDVYTIAANAALRLIVAYDVDPRSVGLLALGTESSKDNSAGAVIVRGMLDHGLAARGLPRLSRACEVPEFKHACLGGIYGLKSALRYVATDGADRKAIVVSGDIAEYERGSTGEQTQGAGALAMLVERNPTMFSVDLAHSGSASAYRGPDFRKPFARHFMEGYATNTGRLHDFPVFSGKYSTFAYIDATVHAVGDLLRRNGRSAKGFYKSLRAIFLHRPYALMPVQGVAFLFVRALAGAFLESDEDRERLTSLCVEAGADLDAVLAEATKTPDLFGELLSAKEPTDPYPQTTLLASFLRKTPYFQELLGDRLSLGADKAMDLGNLYTAALPAWLAAGFEHAVEEGMSLAGESLLAIGYGSGDAAEALSLRVESGWEDAARRIDFRGALADPVDLSRDQYEALHDGEVPSGLEAAPRGEFRIGRTGSQHDVGFQDIGVEYYEYEASES